MSVFAKQDYPVKWISVGEISVLWANTQRPLKKRKVEKIVEEFNPDAFGVLTVTMPNGHGIYHAIDGQHRKEAVQEMWGLDEKVPCLVLNAREPKEAAQIWRTMNGGRTKPGALEDFQVAVAAGEPTQTEINDLVRSLGYRIDLQGHDGNIAAVGALLYVYRRHGIDVLRDTLLTIQATWGKALDSVQQSIIAGFADMLARHGKQVDRKRLVDRVAKKYTPASLIGAARSGRGVLGGSLPQNVTRAIVVCYNQGLSPERRLDEGSVLGGG
jgi:hypothetical protein